MIKKELLVKFIDKYYLGDSIKAVIWKYTAADKTLKTRAELDSKEFTMDVSLKEFSEFSENVRIPIASTQKIKSMLSPFGEDVTLTLNKPSDRILGFTISDKDCESYCVAADPSAIPPVTKDLTDTHVYDVEISLNKEFVEKFLKSRAALDEIDEFTVKMNKNGQVEFVFGYSVTNTNRISLVAPTINGKDKFEGQPVKYPLKNLIEVLKANKEIHTGVFYYKPAGVFKVEYKTDQFDCSYWQFAKQPKK